MGKKKMALAASWILDTIVVVINVVVIAGPQSSGKTTAWRFLREKYSDAQFVEETNPYTVFPEKFRLGGLVADDVQERIFNVDIEIARGIKDDGLSVLETLMFHTVYYPDGFSYYKEVLRGKHIGIIFIDTKPDVSFERRKSEYERRVDREIEINGLVGADAEMFRKDLMRRYLERIKKLYPIWHKVYEEIDYANKKVMIDNNNISKDEFLGMVDREFRDMVGGLV